MCTAGNSTVSISFRICGRFACTLTRFRIVYIKDEYSVDYIRAADPEIAGYSSNADVQRIMEGHPIGTFYTYEWAGYNNQGAKG